MTLTVTAFGVAIRGHGVNHMDPATTERSVRGDLSVWALGFGAQD
jgi:hypothetical protein